MKEQKPWKPVLSSSETKLQIAYVIDHTNTIEHVLKAVLVRYMNAPSNRKRFMNDILLHSSIINLGAKFKLLHHIVENEGWPKIDRNHFHTLLNIRNAFAHSDTDTIPPITIYVGRTSEDGSLGVSGVNVPDRVVTTLDASGRFTTVGRGSLRGQKFKTLVEADASGGMTGKDS